MNILDFEKMNILDFYKMNNFLNKYLGFNLQRFKNGCYQMSQTHLKSYRDH